MAVFVYRASAVEKGYDPVLENNTWAQIAEASASGVAADLWGPGDTKKIVINGNVAGMNFSNLEIDAFILGINHNAAVEGQNLIHFGIGKIGGVLVGLCDNNYGRTVSSGFCMNTSNTNSGGWENCHMRKTVLGSDVSPTSPRANTMLAALPSDLRTVMKSITKYTDNTGGGGNAASHVTSTSDYLPLLSEFEIQGAINSSNSAESSRQIQYNYYASGNGKAHHKHNSLSQIAAAWCRSPYSMSENHFCMVTFNSTGSPGANYANYSFSISPIFAV